MKHKHSWYKPGTVFRCLYCRQIQTKENRDGECKTGVSRLSDISNAIRNFSKWK